MLQTQEPLDLLDGDIAAKWADLGGVPHLDGQDEALLWEVRLVEMKHALKTSMFYTALLTKLMGSASMI
jgi:hypothetical protein